MSTINDGGPAFSGSYEEFDCDNDRWRVVSSGGMTLRDYFAAKAMVGIMAMIAAGRHDPRSGMSAEASVAVDAYRMADAMLKAREA